MKTKFTLITSLVVMSIGLLVCPYARALDVEQSQDVSQPEVETPTHVRHFIELLKSDHKFKSKHVFAYDKRARKIARSHLNSLKERFQSSDESEIVATKTVGDFSLSIIKFKGGVAGSDEMAGLMMFRAGTRKEWKFISESNVDADVCRSMFDRRQLGAFWTLLMWAEENGLRS